MLQSEDVRKRLDHGVTEWWEVGSGRGRCDKSDEELGDGSLQVRFQRRESQEKDLTRYRCTKSRCKRNRFTVKESLREGL